MKLHHDRQTNRGLTLVEVMIILCIICFLSIMLIPRLGNGAQKRAQKITCINNLKQDMLAIRIWGGDHDDKYPTQASVTNGGAMELMNTSEAWRAFQVMSNELGIPLVLHCPEDKTRTPATNFDDSLRQHISYFINVDATDTDPQSIVFGDSTLEFHKTAVPPGFFNMASNDPPQWSYLRHNGSGNVALADGSVQVLNNTNLSQALTATGLATNRLFIP